MVELILIRKKVFPRHRVKKEKKNEEILQVIRAREFRNFITREFRNLEYFRNRSNHLYYNYMKIQSKEYEKTSFCYFRTLGYKNHKSSKILPKFSSNLHFLQESHKFVQELQILQICYHVEHFLQDSDNIFAKNAFFRKKFLQKM